MSDLLSENENLPNYMLSMHYLKLTLESILKNVNTAQAINAIISLEKSLKKEQGAIEKKYVSRLTTYFDTLIRDVRKKNVDIGVEKFIRNLKKLSTSMADVKKIQEGKLDPAVGGGELEVPEKVPEGELGSEEKDTCNGKEKKKKRYQEMIDRVMSIKELTAGERVKILKGGDLTGKTGKVRKIENPGEEDECVCVIVAGEIYKFKPRELQSLEEENE
jgi:hypothetical protein